ncbi:menaquinol-cytochrome c reductase iron-sulfur subunit precursor [Salana multivorans]|uniref:Cytochrome bc1 complex Rieske iron-sulfur subunit n=1 Tax=Salana multivorans TaxID=120377 RepID=A0A3N2D1R8_9MICO|nr:Rieske 2Fe-2S domain-containing protein [Salana multivorans]MBN8881829.1 Rieske (2Fe-2S) protein [Salana multivorans]OJX94471.1 MAG: ubiquinol-cytochrome C reductase [Micrococcales bacterium 73-15]ROR93703.1 menaquinol-cytochrome c reductase iron-sulfur subunit precursor [Salana multivorans]
MSNHSTELETRGELDPAPSPERFENPGLPPHRPRLSDTSPEGSKRAERQVAIIFGISILATIAGVWGYFAFPMDAGVGNVRYSTLSIGLGLGIGMLGIGIAAVHWAKALMSDVEVVDQRHPQRGDDATRAAAVADLQAGAKDSGIARRPLLKGALITAVAIAPLSFLVPFVGNLGGSWNVNAMRHTMWRKGTRLATDPDGRLIRPEMVTIGSVWHVIPDGLHEVDDVLAEKAKAIVLLVRLAPEDLKILPGREDWSYDGIVAYSKVCTHVGCPVALYEQQTHHLLCPCHQSTFDVADGAKVVFGPAKRALPQLPIMVDDEGYLAARDDFDEAVGPSTWERQRPIRGEDY